MPHRYESDWDELARREPYFAVLTDRRYLGKLDDAARREFFASGEADVARLFALAGEPARPRAALDFGCGVGRLTLALAKRAERVVGCDVSPEMTTLARKNAAEAGITNATFAQSLDQLRDQRFDFIVSLIVFQHIPTREGLRMLEELLALLAPGGVAVLHFSLRRPGSALRRAMRRIRANVPLIHRVAQWWEGDELRLPYMQMNEYDPAEVQRRVRAATGAEAQVIPHRDRDIEGALFIVRR